MFNQFSSQHKAILLALIGFSSFSFADAGAKWLSQSYSIHQTIGLVQLSVITILLCCSKPLGGIKTLIDQSARANAKIHLFRGTLNAAINILIVYAFTQLPLATVYTAIFTKPYIAAILAIPLFGQAIGWHRAIAITIGFTGVLVAFEPWTQSFPLIMILVLIALPLIIALMFMASRWLQGGSLLAMAFWPAAISAIVNCILAFSDLSAIAWGDVSIFLVTGVFGAIGITCVSKAFQTGDSAAVSPMVYIEMLWGVILGFALFTDIPSANMIAGSAIIIASGCYLIYREKDAP